MTLRFPDPSGSRSVDIDDDGRVAYAYLRRDDRIVADVWLYNVGGDPETVDWRDRAALPFQNPASYTTGEALPRIDACTNVECRWDAEGVTLIVEGTAWARLAEGSKPGWSRAARVAGPLAKPLAPSLRHIRM
ncbi:MAG: hypothetical protein U0229_18505 [Anaeromyxobacter sp.]